MDEMGECQHSPSRFYPIALICVTQTVYGECEQKVNKHLITELANYFASNMVRSAQK